MSFTKRAIRTTPAPISPATDPSSLGKILLDLRIITKEQLAEAIERQQTMRKDTLLGVLMVGLGYITPAELDTAIAAQQGMRKHNAADHALAVADLALERGRRKTLVEQRERVVQKGRVAARSISDEYVTVKTLVPQLPLDSSDDPTK